MSTQTFNAKRFWWTAVKSGLIVSLTSVIAYAILLTVQTPSSALWISIGLYLLLLSLLLVLGFYNWTKGIQEHAFGFMTGVLFAVVFSMLFAFVIAVSYFLASR